MKGEAMTGIERIAAERKRQIEEEVWTAEHDDLWTREVLANAAACYAMPYRTKSKKVTYDGVHYHPILDFIWPFSEDWYNPSPDNRIREMEKAGAFCAAEIDRLQRLEEKEHKE
jgi:hypothetical protein